MNQKLFGFFCLVLWQVLPASADPVINEIMYHPPSTNLLQQWVEVYNPDTNAVDLSGWRLGGDVDFAFPSNTVLAAGAYLVVAADRATFASLYPGVNNVVGGWNGSVNNNVKLDDNIGQTISSVKFAHEGDWGTRGMGAIDPWGRQGWESSAPHDGLGNSLELINPSLPTIYGQNWVSSSGTGATPGHPNRIPHN